MIPTLEEGEFFFPPITLKDSAEKRGKISRKRGVYQYFYPRTSEPALEKVMTVPVHRI